MARMWRVVEGLLIVLLAIALFYFLKTLVAYVGMPPVHRNRLMLAAGGLGFVALLKWALHASHLGDPDWVTLRCGGRASAIVQRQDREPHFTCSNGCEHDRSEIGAALSAVKADRSERQAWITGAVVLMSLSVGAVVGPTLGASMMAQAIIVAGCIAFGLAMRSRSTALKVALGACCAVGFVVFLGSMIDVEEYGELIVYAIALPFALFAKANEDDD